ncbi:MAG: hypothetical protein HY060_17975 [Proteobacteria bacterium]|nr:hypothetical protein [Pseudomonadota bacterium]
MGAPLMVMFARIRFSNFLAPVLSECDDAQIAVAASRILRDRAINRIGVIPLIQDADLTGTTYAMLSGATEWHAVRLLVAQGKLPANLRLPVRIVMNRAQWRRAGLIAHVAEAAHAVSIGADRHDFNAAHPTVH